MLGNQVYADSIIFDGPGMKVENRHGWFGTKSSHYEDALGNRVERDTGLLGRKTTRTRVFGTESIQSPRETKVVDVNGNPLLQSRNTWFHGKETRIDGNAILNSFKGLLQP